MSTVTRTIRIPKDLDKKLKEQSDSLQQSVNKSIIFGLENAIENGASSFLPNIKKGKKR